MFHYNGNVFSIHHRMWPNPSSLPRMSTTALRVSFLGWHIDGTPCATPCTSNPSARGIWRAPPPLGMDRWRRWAAVPTGGCGRWERCCRSKRWHSQAGLCCRQSPCSHRPTPAGPPPQTPSPGRWRPWRATLGQRRSSTYWPHWGGPRVQTSS